jgi:hypothetical protein
VTALLNADVVIQSAQITPTLLPNVVKHP